MARLYRPQIFNPVAVAAAVAHHFDGRRLSVLAGGHHVRAGGGQGDAELVGANFRTHAVRPYNFAIPIRNFQCHRPRIRHRQVYVGGPDKRVRVVLRQS